MIHGLAAKHEGSHGPISLLNEVCFLFFDFRHASRLKDDFHDVKTG
jgi:hypothetical protein